MTKNLENDPACKVLTIYIYLGKKVKQLVIMGFPIGDLFSIRSFLLAGAQTCQLFENDLMATCKRSKETNSDFIVRT